MNEKGRLEPDLIAQKLLTIRKMQGDAIKKQIKFST
jgi:hypothetical protein